LELNIYVDISMLIVKLFSKYIETISLSLMSHFIPDFEYQYLLINQMKILIPEGT